MYIKWQLYNPDLASYVKLMVGKYYSRKPLVNQTQICEIYLHMCSEGLKYEIIKHNSQNVYQMAIILGFGFIYVADHGKVL